MPIGNNDLNFFNYISFLVVLHLTFQDKHFVEIIALFITPLCRFVLLTLDPES